MDPVTIIAGITAAAQAINGFVSIAHAAAAMGEITPQELDAVMAKAKASDSRWDELVLAARARIAAKAKNGGSG